MRRVLIECEFQFGDESTATDDELGKAVYETIELAKDMMRTPDGVAPTELQLSDPIVQKA